LTDGGWRVRSPEGSCGCLYINTLHDASIKLALVHQTKNEDISEGKDGGEERQRTSEGNIA
jgi:hypothetical protein